MKTGTWTRITVDFKEFEAQFIGKGRYARAFLEPKSRLVYLFVQGCYLKEGVSMWADKLPHVPAITRHESQDDCHGETVHVFSMPFYAPLRACHKTAWAQFRELQRANEEARSEICQSRDYQGKFKRLSVYGYDVNRLTIERANVPASLKAALETMADAILNYGCGCTFEVNARNLGVDDQGRLVLRDICFDAEKLEEEDHGKMRRALARANYRSF